MGKPKPIRWTAAHYRAALLGDKGEGVPGLRSYVRGLGAASGFDLRRVDEWSASKKRKVREAYHGVRALEAQEKYPVRSRSRANLKVLQDTFHGDIKVPGLKVALVPYTAPKALPGAKRPAPKVRVRKGAVSIDVGIYRREFVAFNPLALIEDAAGEVKRVLSELTPASLYYVKTGEYQTLSARGATALTAKVRLWMAQYDGKKPLPPKRGRKDANPRNHAWWQWLHGVYAVVPGKGIGEAKAAQMIDRGMKAAKVRNAARDKKMRKRK